MAFHIGRRHALYFEYVGQPNFDNVTKSEFHEVTNRTRGDRKIVSTTSSLASMIGTMPPPPPPRSL
jgi:hypothetical protein